MEEKLREIVYAVTDLHRAHAIIKRINKHYNIKRDALYALESAFLSAYRKPFLSRSGDEPILKMSVVGVDLSASEIDCHARILFNAEMFASCTFEERANFQNLPFLGGAKPSLAEVVVEKIRRRVALLLYPDLADEPEFLEILNGPIQVGLKDSKIYKNII